MKRKNIFAMIMSVILVIAMSVTACAEKPQTDEEENSSKQETYTVHAVQEYCHGVTISPAGEKQYAEDEEITYTMTGEGECKPSYFVIDGKRVDGVKVDENTMTYTFTERRGSECLIYGIGEKTPGSTYTVDMTKKFKNGMLISPEGDVHTYSTDEEATYTISGMSPPGYFVINEERVEGTVIDENTISYTFPKGTTGVYTLYGMGTGFVDVRRTDWFYDSVQYVNEHELMTGLDDGIFGAGDTLVRAQFAVILHRMEDEPLIKHAITFEDVEHNSWYTDAVRWTDGSKIMTGYEDNGLFGTNDPITREQMATVMYRYAKTYKKYDVSKKADFSKFEDASSVTEFAKDAMKWAVGNGIITGKDGGTKLDPQGYANRAECAAIIQRFLEKYE